MPFILEMDQVVQFAHICRLFVKPKERRELFKEKKEEKKIQIRRRCAINIEWNQTATLISIITMREPDDGILLSG